MKIMGNRFVFSVFFFMLTAPFFVTYFRAAASFLSERAPKKLSSFVLNFYLFFLNSNRFSFFSSHIHIVSNYYNIVYYLYKMMECLYNISLFITHTNKYRHQKYIFIKKISNTFFSTLFYFLNNL